MPADRRIIVNVSAEGHRDEHGEYVPGAITEHRLWATDIPGAPSQRVQRCPNAAQI